MEDFESLARANEIYSAIKDCKLNIKKWEAVLSFERGSTITSNFQERGFSYVSTHHIPFDICKMMSIKGFQEDIKKLEEEFSKLP